MFVRLFVDENLDRHVPISKQPKEKIQVISVFGFGFGIVVGMSQYSSIGEICRKHGSTFSPFGDCCPFASVSCCQRNFF